MCMIFGDPTVEHRPSLNALLYILSHEQNICTTAYDWKNNTFIMFYRTIKCFKFQLDFGQEVSQLHRHLIR